MIEEKDSNFIINLVSVVAAVSLLLYLKIRWARIIKMLSIFVLLTLLPLAHFVYPEGIMKMSLANMTLGQIGNLLISVVLVLCCIVGEVYLIRSIRHY